METKSKVSKDEYGYTIFTIEDRFRELKIQVRNVSTKNPESALQIEVTESPKFKGRIKYSSISLPKELIPKFIEAVKKDIK